MPGPLDGVKVVEMGVWVAGRPIRQVATPADFLGTPAAPGNWPPELGQDTEVILLELGYDWDRIASLKVARAIR